MYNSYLEHSEWSIIESGFKKENHMSSESIFSLGNGIFGQRGNFEEDYSGYKLDGNYVGGIFFPDKTKVGWWKVGYPNYFAKTVNCPSWIRLSIKLDGELLDLNKIKVNSYRKELNMKHGVLRRTFECELINGKKIKVESERFISLKIQEVGMLRYTITSLNSDCDITIRSFIDENVVNVDSNWNEQFLKTEKIIQNDNSTFIKSKVLKTDFEICSFSKTRILSEKNELSFNSKNDTSHNLNYKLGSNKKLTIEKIGGYVSNFSTNEDLLKKSSELINKCSEIGYKDLLQSQIELWDDIWKKSDVIITGDVKAQQGIRFNIFQLNQTYMGQNPNLNVGPKGFTGEKYGGGTLTGTPKHTAFLFIFRQKNLT